VDGVRVSKGIPTEIREKQTVMFISVGYTLVRKDYAVCFSSSSGKEKEASMRYAREAGVEVSRDWTAECSHLVLGEYTTTAKVFRAMLQCRHIGILSILLIWVVSHEWIEAVARADPYKFIHPEEARYKPAFSEEFQKQVDYSPLASRKSLYLQDTFVVFTAAQMTLLSSLIPLAGGIVILYDRLWTGLWTADERDAAVIGVESFLEEFSKPTLVKATGAGTGTPLAQVIAQVAKRYFTGNLSVGRRCA
jgi:hypothetical protein